MFLRSVIFGILLVFLMPLTSAYSATTFNYSSWIPWTHPLNKALYIKWMDNIEKRSDGRIKFRKLPKAVAHPRAHLDAVRTSQADAGMRVRGVFTLIWDLAIPSHLQDPCANTHRPLHRQSPTATTIGMNTH